MILNSRKRRQIHQAQREGQRTIASMHSGLVSGGESEQAASEQMTKFVALGSAQGSWWADVGFMRYAKAQIKKQMRTVAG